VIVRRPGNATSDRVVILKILFSRGGDPIA
jgi:hypothetical protein